MITIKLTQTHTLVFGCFKIEYFGVMLFYPESEETKNIVCKIYVLVAHRCLL